MRKYVAADSPVPCARGSGRWLTPIGGFRYRDGKIDEFLPAETAGTVSKQIEATRQEGNEATRQEGKKEKRGYQGIKKKEGGRKNTETLKSRDRGIKKTAGGGGRTGRRVNGGNVLTTEVRRRLPKHDGTKIVYGEGCRLSRPRLKRGGVVFKQVPYEIKVS
jgi:hypothetical protein